MSDLPRQPQILPQHVAIIMDGNGRWALRQGKPRSAGHEAGSEALKRTIQAAHERGIATLTVYAFSSENWRRPRSEVRQLLDLFLRALNREVSELDKHGVKLVFIGDRSAFNRTLREGMQRAERKTEGNTNLTLNVAVNYGGQTDILAAARILAEQARDGQLDPEQIDQERFESLLSLSSVPPPDLFIRTGGERRLSNFLLWQLAYTELYFTDILWPDFAEEHFDAALADFARRERRFGGLGQIRSA
ncbi:polyprenyl diphosphate synthase [Wenzhouxiangella sp. XN201]|uniref:polyprenyl diphosphate synthase n=1 Tax=Wenzhouxiangella sp. XN201 TaxID=2710755 RepID=UPI001F0958B1|nr:polyprenyl diphosphate synthase [Wenzhouxiangella sp. XN201]